MKTKAKKQSTDIQVDKSDILFILESIEQMFDLCQQVLNTYTRDALLLSITTEAEMLLLKLKVLEERWKTHLPFKEATTVNFYLWGKKIRQMAQAIGGDEPESDSALVLDEYCPSKHFVLDLYECLNEHSSGKSETPYYTDPDVGKLISEQIRLKNKIWKRWGEYRVKFSALVPQELNQQLEGVFKPIADHEDDIRKTCYTVLRNLSTVLYDLFESPHGKINADQFARLAERVLKEKEYDLPKVIQTIEHEVQEDKNKTPEDQWEAYCEGERKTALDLIRERQLESKVFNFLGRDKTMLDNPAGLGRFLWSVRSNISKDDLCNLIDLLYRAAYFSKEKEQIHSIEATEAVDQEKPKRKKDAYSVFCERRDMKPKKPRLPIFFSQRLAGNPAAIERYYKVIHHCGFFIGRTLLKEEKGDPVKNDYEGWKWKHLREAFIKLGFFNADSPKVGFAKHLAAVFPYLEVSSIQRGFDENRGYTDSIITSRIIANMVAEFEEVVEMMDD